MLNTIAQNLSLVTCILLLSLGIVFNISLKFFYITKIGHIKKSIFERNPNANISPFSAVTLALAGTLGVGNIVGVASSIYLGGPGSIFWMWIGALFSMILKYSEVLLSIKHRKKINGSYLGGAFS